MASFNATAPPRAAHDRFAAVELMNSAVVRRVGGVLSRAGLVTLFVGFAWANFSHWRTTGHPSGLGTTVLEAWAALLFLVRRKTDEISLRAVAWVAAPIGTFAMLLARPAGGGLPESLCEVVQLAGLAIALLSLGTLGRSFGIIAANRGVKTTGPYSLVRHPAYVGYLVTYLGYVAENPSFWNVALLIVSTSFQLVRIREEEQVLLRDETYAAYRAAVRYRLIPLIY